MAAANECKLVRDVEFVLRGDTKESRGVDRTIVQQYASDVSNGVVTAIPDFEEIVRTGTRYEVHIAASYNGKRYRLPVSYVRNIGRRREMFAMCMGMRCLIVQDLTDAMTDDILRKPRFRRLNMAMYITERDCDDPFLVDDA